VLLIAIISPVLLSAYFKCVVVSNPSVTTARIEQIEPIMPRVGDIMRVTGSGNGTPPLQFAWDFGDGTLAAGVEAAHAYMAPGSYSVTLTVRDATGNTASDSSQVAVSARVSPSAFSLVLATDAVAGQPVLFAALPLEGNAGALSYVWTFSDGQSAIGPWATATFPVAGTYLASVTVTNDLGTIAVAQVAFQVVDAETGAMPNPAPVEE
jgi:PKD repeat protein